MKISILSLAIIALVATSVVAEFPSWKESHSFEQHPWRLPGDNNSHQLGVNGGGSRCVLCTLVLHLVEDYSNIHSMAIDDFIENHFCTLFSDQKIQSSCQEIATTWGPSVVKALSEDADPDTVCQKVGICTDPTCDFIHDTKEIDITFSDNWERYVARNSSPSPDSFGKSFDWLKDLLHKVFKNHLPASDLDGDKFSGSIAQMRGSHWRGKDCDDLDNKIYPGRKVNPQTKAVDFNCNGISGTNPDTGAAYEDELCGASNQMGVAVLGDSAGAHFEIPPQWMNATEWQPGVFDGMLGKLLDELDIPHKGTYTGYTDTSEKVPVRSIYKKMLEVNKCNHRDFQNMGVNGGASGSLFEVQAIARDPQNDHPLLMFLELAGNDVCNLNHNFSSMTTPEEFNANIVKTLTFLDTVAPAGSHLVILGLANGSVLYETLHDQLHPTGLPYPDVYDFLNCLGISPCWGWMNSDADTRKKTSEVAASLNAEYPKIVADNKFNNFDIQFYGFPIEEIMSNWIAAGNNPVDLIEPIDGFHPSQITDALLADWMWEHIQQDHPDWIPETNVNNDKITQLFADQGGY